MEDWAEIRRLYRSENLSQAAIAERLSLSRNTVAKAVHSDAPPRYVRTPMTTSAWVQIELAVRALLGEFPTMRATVLAQRFGWTGGHSWFAENVARIRPEYALPIRVIGWFNATEARVFTERDILRSAAKYFAGETNW